jgi:hypothetical protein
MSPFKTFCCLGRLISHALAFADALRVATAPVAVCFGVLSLINIYRSCRFQMPPWFLTLLNTEYDGSLFLWGCLAGADLVPGASTRSFQEPHFLTTMATATVGTNHVHPCHSFHVVFGIFVDFVTLSPAL